MLYFPPYLASVSALPGEREKRKIAPFFHLNAVCCFANKHTKLIQVINWAQLQHPLSIND